MSRQLAVKAAWIHDRMCVVWLVLGLAVSQGGCAYIARQSLNQHLVPLPAFVSQIKQEIVIASACTSFQDPMFYLGDVQLTLRTVITGEANAGVPIPIGLVPITLGASLSDTETQEIVITLKPYDVSLGGINIFLKKKNGDRYDEERVPGTVENAAFIGERLVYHVKPSPNLQPTEYWIEKDQVSRIETESRVPNIFVNLSQDEREILCTGGKEAKPILQKVLHTR